VKSFVIALAGSLCLALSGCSSNPGVPDRTAKLAVTYATMKGVEQGLDPVRTRAVAESAKAIISGEAVTLTALQEAIGAELTRLDLSPADRMLAGLLVAAIADEVKARIGTGFLDPEQKVKVVEVLQWVIDATYLGAPVE
jgi:hypothetical protein